MKRKAKGPKPPPRVWREMERQQSDHIQFVQGPGTVPRGIAVVPRLGTHWQRFPYDADEVASSINFQSGGVFFCDSTLFLAPTDARIWNALLRERRIALIPPIVDEVQWWLADCKGVNTEAHRQLHAHLSGDTRAPVRMIEQPPFADLAAAGLYYVNLLGIRKHMLSIARRKLEKQIARPPSTQEVSNYCQQAGTSRAQLLGRQGEDLKVPGHVYNDEWLVVSAVLFAIATGNEVTVISSDEAVLDQFCKLVYLLTWHYVAMLLADRYAANPLAFSTQRMANPDTSAFADDEVLLVRKPSAFPLELLPRQPRRVMIHCMLLHQEVARVTFNADREMRRLLEVKGRTGGLSTDRLDSRNCHLFLTQVAGSKVGDVAAIAHDIAAPVGSTPIKLSCVDLELALLSNEQNTPIKVIDPGVLLLPPGSPRL
jgi:hypothetical protein